MTPGPIQLADEVEPEYEVESILRHRTGRGGRGRQFLVRWRGYGPEHDLWLNEGELRNASQVLTDYLATVKE